MSDTLLSLRKNKIHLEDFDFQKEIQNRQMLSALSSQEEEILEEIFFSSSKLSLLKLSRKFMTTTEKMQNLLQKFSQLQLLSIVEDQINVDKHVRKNLELHMQRFEPGFEPDIEYMLNTLKTLPIHLLPVWYAIPRTSSDIFQSIIDKYVKTPHTYKRYMQNLCFEAPLAQQTCSILHASANYEAPLSDIEKSLNISPEELSQLLLYLEYSMICIVIYKDKKAWVSFFREWKEYLHAIDRSSPLAENAVANDFSDPYAFITYMEGLVAYVEKKPVKVLVQKEEILLIQSQSKQIFEQFPQISSHIIAVIQKLLKLKLLNLIDDHLYPSKDLKTWKNLSQEEKALYLYRAASNEPFYSAFPVEKILREMEGNFIRFCQNSWILLEDFLAYGLISFSSDDLTLHKKGKNWAYQLPTYGDAEKRFIKEAIETYYFEAGILFLGKHKDKLCFTLTPFGKKLLKTE